MEVWVLLFFSSLCPSPWLGEDRRLSLCSPLASEGDPTTHPTPHLGAGFDNRLKVTFAWCGFGFLSPICFCCFFRLTGHFHTHTARVCCFCRCSLVVIFHRRWFHFVLFVFSDLVRSLFVFF